MVRTVPTSGNNEIDLYIRTYYSLLRSTRPVQIKSLIETHKGMQSALHSSAHTTRFDSAAFSYALLRTPDCLDQTEVVLMGQSAQVFTQHGFSDVESWQEVNAAARRRRSYYDGRGTLGVFIASRSDIDDLVPVLTAYQIERNKLHDALHLSDIIQFISGLQQENGGPPSAKNLTQLAALTNIPCKDWERLVRIWGSKTTAKLLAIARQPQELAIRSLAGSLADYKRATRRWWRNVESQISDVRFDERPIYFVSSNTHTMANLLAGFALQKKDMLDAFIHTHGGEELQQEYQAILANDVPSSRENCLYYALKKYEGVHPQASQTRLLHERQRGIERIPSKHAFDIEVQVVSLADLELNLIDPRLNQPDISALAKSRALIVNIDYPLGMAAYQVLTEIARNVAEVRGVYSMGKAASLNGRIGDIMIPNVVHDEHSLNTYLFTNSFTADDVAPYLVYGTVMDNQKAITVPGTFLQNKSYMSVFYQEGYTDMEMEAGPYMSCIYEMVRPKRHPYNEIVNLNNIPFPIGFLHYTSDTPFSKGINLGSQNLSYFGMDATYASMIAILREILRTEIQLMS